MQASVVSVLGEGCRAGVIFCESVHGLMRQGRPVKVRCAHACRAVRCDEFAVAGAAGMKQVYVFSTIVLIPVFF